MYIIIYYNLNTRAEEGLRITRPAISAPRKAGNAELRGLVGPHKNSFWCKFRDLRLTFSRSHDVIIAKFSQFLVQRAEHHFSWPGTQSKADSFNPQKAEEVQ